MKRKEKLLFFASIATILLAVSLIIIGIGLYSKYHPSTIYMNNKAQKHSPYDDCVLITMERFYDTDRSCSITYNYNYVDNFNDVKAGWVVADCSTKDLNWNNFTLDDGRIFQTYAQAISLNNKTDCGGFIK